MLPLTEDQKRLAIRQEMKKHNKSLAEAAHQAGVETSYDFAVFQNKGYQGLYGGLGKREIAIRKGLKPSADILDHKQHRGSLKGLTISHPAVIMKIQKGTVNRRLAHQLNG